VRSGWRAAVRDWFAKLSPRTLLVPAGAMTLVVVAIVITQTPRQNGVPVEQKAGIESEVKQIERTLDDLDVLSTIDAAFGPEVAQEKL
jgi:hypothetical protein